MTAVDMVEVWRGDFLESVHQGHAVICDARGDVVEAWGDPSAVILPRSSAKMIQALPLIESGAAARAGLTPAHLALACASHNGQSIHTEPVRRWLSDLGLDQAALRCGPQPPDLAADRQALRDARKIPDQTHNNCSGKHSGFLTLGQHLGAGPDYIDPDHPVQRAVRAAFEDMTGADKLGFAIDGCSAPNFACSLKGLATAMAQFASAAGGASSRDQAATELWQAMSQHPDLVAGDGRACTRIMTIAGPRAVVKTGAEGVFVAILPELGLGVALKIADGATRASDVAITSLLARLGIFDAADPRVQALMTPVIRNRRDVITGRLSPSGTVLTL